MKQEFPEWERKDWLGTDTQGIFWGRASLPKLGSGDGCSTVMFQKLTQF